MRSRNICGGRWMGNWVRPFRWPFFPPGVHPVASPHYPAPHGHRQFMATNDVLSLCLSSRPLSFNYHFIPSGATHALPQGSQTESLWSIGRFRSPHSHSLGLFLSSHISPHHSALGLMGTNWDLCLPPCDPVRSSSICETMPPPG